jgi:hypothetical protein
MILYDWVKIYRKTEGNPAEILSVLQYLTYPSIPKNHYSKNYQFSQVDWTGDSFLLHPEKVIAYRSHYSDTELAEYVALASFRSLAHYEATGERCLDLLQSPIPRQLIRENRLLSCVQGKIYFCWEEVTH